MACLITCVYVTAHTATPTWVVNIHLKNQIIGMENTKFATVWHYSGVQLING